MTVTEFIEHCELLGYPCYVEKNGVTIYKFYGEKLQQKMRIGWVSLKTAHHFKLSLDPASVSDGIGELIQEFGTTSLMRRGKLSYYQLRDLRK